MAITEAAKLTRMATGTSSRATYMCRLVLPSNLTWARTKRRRAVPSWSPAPHSVVWPRHLLLPPSRLAPLRLRRIINVRGPVSVQATHAAWRRDRPYTETQTLETFGDGVGCLLVRRRQQGRRIAAS